MTTVSLTVNGRPTTLEAPPMKRLLDVLREDLHLTGAKEGCGEGECGSCSVLLDTGHGAELVNSCLIPILQCEDAHITTIEGLAVLTDLANNARAEGALYPSSGQRPGLPDPAEDSGLKARAAALPQNLHPIQQCFLQHGGAQCGICTPGMILATHYLLSKYPHPTFPQIQEGLAGNLCRCTGYMRIFEAVHQAANHQPANHQPERAPSTTTP